MISCFFLSSNINVQNILLIFPLSRKIIPVQIIYLLSTQKSSIFVNQLIKRNVNHTPYPLSIPAATKCTFSLYMIHDDWPKQKSSIPVTPYAVGTTFCASARASSIKQPIVPKAQKPWNKQNNNYTEPSSIGPLVAYLSSYLKLSFSTRANHYSRQDILKPVICAANTMHISLNNCSAEKLHISHSKLTLRWSSVMCQMRPSMWGHA